MDCIQAFWRLSAGDRDTGKGPHTGWVWSLFIVPGGKAPVNYSLRRPEGLEPSEQPNLGVLGLGSVRLALSGSSFESLALLGGLFFGAFSILLFYSIKKFLVRECDAVAWGRDLNDRYLETRSDPSVGG